MHIQHVPAHYSQVTTRLQDAGYEVVGVSLPSSTSEPHVDGRLVGIEDDVPAVRDAVLDQLNAEKDVVVVTHSYGAIPGTAALTDLGMTARKAAGKHTGVTAIIVISGVLVPPGVTMLAAMGGELRPPYFRENDYTLPFAGPGAIQALYNDLEHNEALKAVWRLKPQSYGINTSPVPDQIAGIADVPLTYLLCNDDNIVPWEVQTMTVQRFQAAGVRVHAEVADSGHSPFLKLPDETAKLVRQAAGETIETGFSQFSG